MVSSPRLVVIFAVLASLGACSTSPSAGADTSESSGSESGSGSETGPSTADLPGLTGTSGGTGVPGDTDELGPNCDEPAYLACVEAELDAWVTCLSECVGDQQSCLDAACEAACEPLRAAAEDACEPLCVDPGQWGGPCADQCEREHDGCTAAGCPALDCDYARYVCIYRDYCSCALLELDFTWAGSCELALPGPPVDASIPFTVVEIGEDELYVGAPGDACDEPEVDAVFAPERPSESILLCEAACQAFEAAGAALVRLGSPPCE